MSSDRPTAASKAPRAEAPAEASSDEMRGHNVRYARQREAFNRQDKVAVRPMRDEIVRINGYGFHLKAKERVQVPAQVAEILEEAGRI